jgi:hypothetical protein
VVFPNAVLPEIPGPRTQEGVGEFKEKLRKFAVPRKLDYSKVKNGLTYAVCSSFHFLGEAFSWSFQVKQQSLCQYL